MSIEKTNKKPLGVGYDARQHSGFGLVGCHRVVVFAHAITKKTVETPHRY